jgi:hypothetical protein
LPEDPSDEALVRSRLRLLPAGGEGAAIPVVGDAERDALVRDFITSWPGSDDGTPVAARVLVDFAADEIDGRPLRWSPVVVRLFLHYGAYRAVREHRTSLRTLEEVTPAWILHAARARGVSEDSAQDALAAFHDGLPELWRALASWA